jgi:hypothetical protein
LAGRTFVDRKAGVTRGVGLLVAAGLACAGLIAASPVAAAAFASADETAAGTFTISASSQSIVAGDRAYVIVHRDGGTAGVVSVSVDSATLPAELASVIAPISTEVTFLDGDAEPKKVPILFLGDEVPGDEVPGGLPGGEAPGDGGQQGDGEAPASGDAGDAPIRPDTNTTTPGPNSGTRPGTTPGTNGPANQGANDADVDTDEPAGTGPTDDAGTGTDTGADTDAQVPTDTEAGEPARTDTNGGTETPVGDLPGGSINGSIELPGIGGGSAHAGTAVVAPRVISQAIAAAGTGSAPFTVSLSDPTGGAGVGTPSSVTISVTTPPTTTPVTGGTDDTGSTTGGTTTPGGTTAPGSSKNSAGTTSPLGDGPLADTGVNAIVPFIGATLAAIAGLASILLVRRRLVPGRE